jgi:hypothetical protein
VPDQNRPGEVPPDLPPEYAEAYRRGYERAYGSADDAPEQGGPRITGPLFADELEPQSERQSEPQSEPRSEPRAFDRQAPVDEPRRVGGAHRADSTSLLPEVPAAPRERPAWLVPVLLAGAVLVLLLGAYVVGRVLSSSLSGTDVADDKPDGVALSEDGSTSATPEQSTSDEPDRPKAAKYRGKVEAATITGADSGCSYPSSVDSAGNTVSYQPRKVYDGDLTTAWRCAGGEGETVTVNLGEPTRIGEVGLVPGYAKTDPRSGVDRYAENNRITKVTWSLGDGTTFTQSFDPSPTDRSVQSVRIPVTRTDEITITIESVEHGRRDTSAISEVSIGRVAG